MVRCRACGAGKAEGKTEREVRKGPFLHLPPINPTYHKSAASHSMPRHTVTASSPCRPNQHSRASPPLPVSGLAQTRSGEDQRSGAPTAGSGAGHALAQRREWP